MPVRPLRRPSIRLDVARLEDRITPVLGAFRPAPIAELGSGYDGVVQLSVGDATGTGALLWTGRHILTAAHVVTNSQGVADQPVTVGFDLPGRSRISFVVPAGNVRVRDDFNPTNLMNDVAVLELPAYAPDGADRYDIYRNSDEVGAFLTMVGYGRVGTGVTGELPNSSNVKHFAGNRYDSLGDRLNIGRGQTLLYDFDNARPANDAFGRIFELHDLGVKEEGTAGRGDSGGPTFVGIGGRRTIIGVTSGSLNATNPANPAVFNPAVDAGFGSISLDTRVSFHAEWIDRQVAGKSALKLDLRLQPDGLDKVPDTVQVSTDGLGSLVIRVNDRIVDTIALEQVGTLAVVGAGAEVAPFPTSLTVDADVPAWLSIALERIGRLFDFRPIQVSTPREEIFIEIRDPSDPTAPPIFVPSPTPDADPLPIPTTQEENDPANPTEMPTQERPSTDIDLTDIPNAISAKRITAIGAGAGGGPRVRVIDPEFNTTLLDFFPFEATFTGGVQTALADVNGDLIPDLIVAAGVGGAPRVAIYDGVNWNPIFDSFVFESELRGGVTVAAGDVNGDGFAELIVGAGVGGGPRVRVLDLKNDVVLYDFFAFDSNQRGGVNLAAGDINNDGTTDLIIGAGIGTEPVVRVLDGSNPTIELRSFSPYSRLYRGGVSVAAGDLNGDNRADIVTAPANGGGPHIRVYNGRSGDELSGFFAFNPADNAQETGARVGIADVDGDGLGEIVVGEGPGGGRIRTFSGTTGAELRTFTPFDDAFTGGVFVG